MPTTRLSRPNQTWALAYPEAFANPAAPTAAELNASRYVHLISCALTEDGTELSLTDSDTDDTVTFCDVGNVSTRTYANINAQATWLVDANTGGSGSTNDPVSLFNKVTSLLSFPDKPFWFISRTGPNASQDIPFAVGQVIKMVSVNTDYAIPVLEQNAPSRMSQTFTFNGQVNYNYTIAS